MVEEITLFEDSPAEAPTGLKKKRRMPRKKAKRVDDESMMDSLFGVETFDEIEESPEMITEAEVEAAARTMGLAHFIKQSNRYKLYSFEEEQKIFTEYRKTGSIELRNQILCANIKLVIMVAKKIAHVNSKFDIDDMIGEGTLGLIRAIEKFEPERKLKFSTYAYPWIKQNITRAIANTGDTIRLPVHFSDMINKINKCEINYCQENGCEEVPDEEIQEKLDLTPEKLMRFRTAARVTNSLDADISNPGEKAHFVSYKDLLVDEASPTPEEALDEKAWQEEFLEAVESVLSPREIFIVTHRFGIANRKQMTLDILSKKLHLTRERIRQIESLALAKLREPLAEFATNFDTSALREDCAVV